MAVLKAQYTIRGVPADVDQTLRQMAKARRISLNRYLVDELKRIADRESDSELHHDLDFAIGSMKDGNLVDDGLREFSRIDEELWK